MFSIFTWNDSWTFCNDGPPDHSYDVETIAQVTFEFEWLIKKVYCLQVHIKNSESILEWNRELGITLLNKLYFK